MGFTVSGHVVVEDGVALDRVAAVLDELAAEIGLAHTHVGSVFAFGGSVADDDFAAWLTAFEGALAGLGDATGNPRVVRRAVVLLDAPERPHPNALGGLHLYRWARPDGSDAALQIEHDDVIAPAFCSRFAAPEEDRVEAFVQRVLASGTVYGLRGDGWARAGSSDAPKLPFWGDAVAAARAARGEWSGYAPKAIALDDWMTQWLTGMVEDGIAAAVSPKGPDDEAWTPSAELLDRLTRAQR